MTTKTPKPKKPFMDYPVYESTENVPYSSGIDLSGYLTPPKVFSDETKRKDEKNNNSSVFISEPVTSNSFPVILQASFLNILNLIALEKTKEQPYEVLHLKEGATLPEIRCSFRRLSRKYDPSWNPEQKKECEQNILQLNTALVELESKLETTKEEGVEDLDLKNSDPFGD